MPTKQIRDFDAVVTPATGDRVLAQQAADNVTRYITPDQVLSLIATISQAEAEAGVATTRRIFTAERVAQAIAALPATVSEADAAAGTATDRRAWTAQRVRQSHRVHVLGKTANYTVTTSDLAKLIDATANTWTLTLPAAATAADGFWFAVRNSGTGVITVDPDGAELIDGAATIPLAPGDACLVVCSGTAWKTVGRRGARLVRKTGDDTISSDDSLNNDDELLLPLLANEVVKFEAFIIYNSGTTPDIKFAFTVPAAATIVWAVTNARYSPTAADEPVTVAASGTSLGFSGNAADVAVLITGTVVNGANAGNLQLQWAQQTSDASNTTVKTNSWLRKEPF